TRVDVCDRAAVERPLRPCHLLRLIRFRYRAPPRVVGIRDRQREVAVRLDTPVGETAGRGEVGGRSDRHAGSGGGRWRVRYGGRDRRAEGRDEERDDRYADDEDGER